MIYCTSTKLTADVGLVQRVEALEGCTALRLATDSSVQNAPASRSFKRYEFGFSLRPAERTSTNTLSHRYGLSDER